MPVKQNFDWDNKEKAYKFYGGAGKLILQINNDGKVYQFLNGSTTPTEIVSGGGGDGGFTITVSAYNAYVASITRAKYNCIGSNDNVVIQQAIDEAAATGGHVHLTEGTYNLAAAVNPCSNVTISGEGDSTVINAGAVGQNVFYVNTKQGVRITNLKIGSTVTKTDGAGIFFYACQYCYADNIFMEDQYWAIRQTGSTIIKYNTMRLYDNVYGGIGVDGAGVDLFLDNISIAQPSTTHATVGIYLNGISGLYATNVAVGTHDYSLMLDPVTGATNQNLFFTNCIFDFGANYGIFASNASGGTNRGIKFDNCWSASFPFGMYLKGASTVQWTNGLMVNIGQDGITLDTDTSDVNIDGKFYAIGIDTNNTYAGVAIAANVSNWSVKNSTFRNSGWGYTAQSKYWILVAAGTSNNYEISGNDYAEAAGTANISDGGTGTTKVVTIGGVTTSWQGLVPKLPNDATKYFNGVGTWGVPSGSGGGVGGTLATTSAPGYVGTLPNNANLFFNGLGSYAAVVGSGIGVQQIAGFVVATTARAVEKAMAEVLCDGANDEAQIAQMDNDIARGKVLLSTGEYKLHAALTLDAGAMLIGQGAGVFNPPTKLTIVGSTYGILITPVSSRIGGMRDLAIYTGSAYPLAALTIQNNEMDVRGYDVLDNIAIKAPGSGVGEAGEADMTAGSAGVKFICTGGFNQCSYRKVMIFGYEKCMWVYVNAAAPGPYYYMNGNMFSDWVLSSGKHLTYFETLSATGTWNTGDFAGNQLVNFILEPWWESAKTLNGFFTVDDAVASGYGRFYANQVLNMHIWDNDNIATHALLLNYNSVGNYIHSCNSYLRDTDLGTDNTIVRVPP